MADEPVRETTTRETAVERPVADERELHEERVDQERREVAGVEKAHKMDVVSRVVWLVTGIIIGLLAIRFLLRLLGANPANGFADFIYTLSQPFAAPFFGLFNYTADLLEGRFEFETLIAMLVYTLIAWMIVKIVNVARR